MFHHRMLRMAFCICLGFLMGAYLAKGFSQENLQPNVQSNSSFTQPIIDSIKTSVDTLERSFLETSLHVLRLKYDEAYRDNYSFSENSAIISQIGESNLQNNTILSQLTLNIGEQAITSFYGDALSTAAKSDAVVADRIQGFKELCLEKGGYLLKEWDTTTSMNDFEDKWLFKPIFWYKGTSIGVDSGVLCLKSL